MLEVSTNEVNQLLSRIPYIEVVKCSCIDGANYSQITFVLRVAGNKKRQWYELMKELLTSADDDWQPYIAQRYLIIDNEMRYRWELVLKVVSEEGFMSAMRSILGIRTPEGAQRVQKIPLPWVPDGDRNVPDKKGRGVYRLGSMGDVANIGLSKD